MSGLLKYCIDIVSLKDQEYQYNYSIGPSFFQHFKESEIENCSLECFIVLRKTEGFIEAKFRIEGMVELECDRSLEKFEYPIDLERKMIFKYGEEDMEIDDEIEMISYGRQSIDMSQFIFEFISIEIPMKKLHPKYANEEQMDDEQLFFSSDKASEKETDSKEIDPRWEALKKLKNN